MKGFFSQGYLQIIISSIILGSLGIFSRLADLPSPIFALGRALFATLGFLVLASFKPKSMNLRPQKQRPRLIASCLLLLLIQLTLFKAFSLTTIANVVVLIFLAPVIVALLAPMVLKEKFSWLTILAAFVAFFGVIVIIDPGKISWGEGNSLGILLALAVSLIFAIFTFLVKRLSEDYSGMEIAFYQFAFVAIALLPTLFFFSFRLSPWVIGILLIVGLVHTVVGNSMSFSALSKIQASHYGIISYVEVLSAVLWAFLFFKETPTFFSFFGSVGIIAAGMMVIFPKARVS